MAAIDFPNSPTPGQIFPNPPVAGQPQYTWDGQVWGSGPTSNVNAVQYDVPQNLSPAQQTQGRQNVYAAPFDALAYSGMQINGSMEVSQENGTTSLAVASGTVKYICDGWKVNVLNAAVNASMWKPSTPAPGLPCALLMQVTTANASPVANDHSYFMQRIEGYRASRLGWGTANAQPITIGFWVAATRTGLFSGSISNDAFNRAYAFSYTIIAAATWEYKTITIPGDTVGTWVNDNSAAGLVLVLLMMGGPTVLTAPGAWGSTGYLGATGQVNCCAATTDWMEITGVVVLPGIEAPSAARSALIMRPYDQELMTCKRYWQQYVSLYVGINTTPTVWAFSTEMRISPAIAGGGAGFSFTRSTTNATAYQTTGAYQTITLDARL